MKAIIIKPGTAGITLVDRQQPAIAADDQVRMQVLRVGICGTDREEVAGGRALAPIGAQELIIGHEMLGRVLEVGSRVTRVRVGDLAVATVRRGCGECRPCLIDRPDMCETGKYTERGIWGRDGYQTEQIIEEERYLAPLPASLEPVGVLVEPMSVVEKALDEALLTQQSRLPAAATSPDWLYGRKCLVVGLGPIGLLASLALRLRGADVSGMDVVDPTTPRPQWLAAIGGHYVNGRNVGPDQVQSRLGAMSFIIEASGVPALAFNLIEALDLNGVFVLTGIPGGARPVSLPASQLLDDLVLRNLLLVGSVNAAVGHYRRAIADMELAEALYPGQLVELITHRYPATDAASSFGPHTPDEIKTVIEWGSK